MFCWNGLFRMGRIRSPLHAYEFDSAYFSRERNNWLRPLVEENTRRSGIRSGFEMNWRVRGRAGDGVHTSVNAARTSACATQFAMGCPA